MRDHAEKLRKLGACAGAVTWADTQPDLPTAWKVCQRGDWMLWLVGKVAAGRPWSDERKPLVLAACECAELALPIYERRTNHSDMRVRVALYAHKEWAEGNSVLARNELVALRHAGRGRVTERVDAAAAYAAYAANAAANAAYAANAAANAAYAAYAASERERVLSLCADIVRKHYPAPPEF